VTEPVAADEVVLTKYEGAGNDFLVHLDLAGTRPLAAEEVRKLCDRHRGVGADGVLRVLGAADADVAMELYNADGGRAEMSGNGIRCLVHAVLDAGLARGPVVEVATDAGRKAVAVRGEPGSACISAEVAMGTVRLGPEVSPPTFPGGGHETPTGRCRRVDVGNPHLVVVLSHEDPAGSDLLDWAAAVDGATPGGCNVELVRVTGPQALELTVWERGAGATLACGTGSCAAAVACAAWGLVGLPTAVANPGGILEVDERSGAVYLAGPSRRVAEVRVDLAALGAWGPGAAR
jgi:diaminopimelate epimerase